MTTLTKPCARDLMRTHVSTMSADSTIREAVRLLEEDRLGGVPVVDDAGRVIGFLSLSDIARIEHLRDDRVSEARGDRRLANPVGEALEEESVDDEEFGDRDDYSPELLGRETVGQWMTSGVVSITPDTALVDICRTMLRESVHRLVVLEKGRLCGIVSTTDIVRHVAEGG